MVNGLNIVLFFYGAIHVYFNLQVCQFVGLPHFCNRIFFDQRVEPQKNVFGVYVVNCICNGVKSG